jgi:DNA-binding transcriptional MocR family regulator
MMTKTPKRASSKLYQQIVSKIRDSIVCEQLRQCDRLPSLREMSETYRVSVGTVLKAYLQLEKENFVQSKPQSGFFVTYDSSSLMKVRPPDGAPVDVEISDLVSMIFKTSQGRGFLSLGASSIPANLLPVQKLNRIGRDLIKQDPEHSSSYLYPPGLEELRIQIAKNCAYFGRTVRADEIVITSGTIDAVNLCLRSVAAPGDSVIVESPSYYGILQLIEFFRMRAIEVPGHPKTGIDLEFLSRVLQKEKVKASVITSNFNNPTGSLMPEENKKAFVETMAKHSVSIIEDDVFGSLYFTEMPQKPLFAYDSHGIVQYCSSFSKTLAPGLRVGWAIPGKLQPQVEKLKYMSSMATASFPQHLVAKYLQSGGYERHLRKLRKSLKSNMSEMINAIYSYFPKGTRVVLPQGGMLLWAELPEPVDFDWLCQEAVQRKIGIAPGVLFSSDRRFNRHLRFTSCLNFNSKVEQAFKTLGDLLQLSMKSTGQR